MKKIFALILCATLLCATPIVAFAEEGETSEPAVEEVTPETETVIPETEETTPETEEVTPEIEEEEAPKTEEVVTETEEKSMTEEIVDYFKSHLEEFSVIGTLLGMVFYEIRKHGKLNGSIGLLNNNAIAMAQNSTNAINASLEKVEGFVEKVEGIANVVMGYKDEFEAVMSEIRKNAEEQKATEETLSHVATFLKTAKLATLELSNEVAELLVLANIPTSKKDELYARHMNAVHELEVAEEVMSNDGKEA